MSADLIQHVLMPANSSRPSCKCAFLLTVPLSINAVVSHYSLIPLPSLSCAWSCSASSQQQLFFLQTTLSRLKHPHLLVWVNFLSPLCSTKLLCDSFCRGGNRGRRWACGRKIGALGWSFPGCSGRISSGIAQGWGSFSFG